MCLAPAATTWATSWSATVLLRATGSLLSLVVRPYSSHDLPGCHTGRCLVGHGGRLHPVADAGGRHVERAGPRTGRGASDVVKPWVGTVDAAPGGPVTWHARPRGPDPRGRAEAPAARLHAVRRLRRDPRGDALRPVRAGDGGRRRGADRGGVARGGPGARRAAGRHRRGAGAAGGRGGAGRGRAR